MCENLQSFLVHEKCCEASVFEGKKQATLDHCVEFY